MKVIGKWIRLILGLIIIGLIIYLGIAAWQIFRTQPIQSEREDSHFFIPSDYLFSDVIVDLDKSIDNFDVSRFQQAAKLAKYNNLTLKYGRYKLPEEASYFELARYLRSGQQDPVNLVLNNARLVEQVAGKAAQYLEPDSIAFLNAFFEDSIMAKFELTPHTLMTLFIPNTYQFLWTTTPEGFLIRMKKEHDNFWRSNQRLEKAKALQLSPIEIYILASIVEKESQVKNERPTIAGLYLNRINKNMRLQADPTVVFAVQDFSIRRVLNRHLEFDSPYNTYLNDGLPPGPICMASINSIDAVLNAESHDYLYMCAAPDLSGGHVFAKSLTEHNINANIYRRWLNKSGIR